MRPHVPLSFLFVMVIFVFLALRNSYGFLTPSTLLLHRPNPFRAILIL
ncbi:hypothetical protein HMPREF0239_01176 [Clostridium sp. ATCC BAA-442]|nr:hypothetical protein HMPREF0239_01176 [Clostridium sp. ATCC BAA-442]